MLNNLKKEEKYILYGIPVIFLLGFLMNFLYEWSGKISIIGSVAVVNESVWEHGKLGLIPLVLWYSIYYLFNKQINKNGWFLAMIISLITLVITIPFHYYFYTGAFGIESMIIDILIFLISLVLGQLIGLFMYKHVLVVPMTASIVICLLIIIIFVTFTFNPPKLPIFHDSSTNRYGIAT